MTNNKMLFWSSEVSILVQNDVLSVLNYIAQSHMVFQEFECKVVCRHRAILFAKIK